MTLYLPDTSEFQPNVNPAGIKKDNGGAMIIRVGYGYAHKDHVFASVRSKAHSAGIKSLGLYHYLVASQDVTKQANQFCAWVGTKHPTEWFALDLEEGSGSQKARADKWVSIVRKKYPNAFITLYSGESFANTHGLKSYFGAKKGWVANYGGTPKLAHFLHQYSDGRYSPIKNWSGAGKCDTSVYSGSLADFVKLTTGGSASTAGKDDDDVPYVVSLACTSQKVSAGKPTWIWFNKEYSDSQKQHANGKYPGILTSAKFCSINAKVTGCNGVYYFVAVNMKTKKERKIDVAEHKRNEVATVTDALYANEHLYLKFIPSVDGTCAAWAKGLYWK